MPGGWRTEKQAACLIKNGQNPNVTFDQASAIITTLKANGWGKGGAQPQQQYIPPPNPSPGGPAQYAPQGYAYPPPAVPQAPAAAPPANPGGCTAKQAALLAKHGYPANVSFDTASQIIDQLKANNWQRPDAAQGAPAPQQQQYAPPQGQYVPPAPQYVAPPTQQYAAPPVPQFQNGQTAPWEGQPQFAGVPSFG